MSRSRESKAKSSASWRERKALKEQEMLVVCNAKRAENNLPLFSLKEQHVSTKGKPRPTFNPPPDKKMSKEELSAWRALERNKRKAARQRENRARKKAILQQVKKELPADFESKIKFEDRRKSKFKYQPAPEQMAKMSPAELSEWRLAQRRNRNKIKQREIRAKERGKKVAAAGFERVKVEKLGMSCLQNDKQKPELCHQTKEMYKETKEDLSWNVTASKQMEIQKQHDVGLKKSVDVNTAEAQLIKSSILKINEPDIKANAKTCESIAEISNKVVRIAVKSFDESSQYACKGRLYDSVAQRVCGANTANTISTDASAGVTTAAMDLYGVGLDDFELTGEMISEINNKVVSIAVKSFDGSSQYACKGRVDDSITGRVCGTNTTHTSSTDASAVVTTATTDLDGVDLDDFKLDIMNTDFLDMEEMDLIEI